MKDAIRGYERDRDHEEIMREKEQDREERMREKEWDREERLREKEQRREQRRRYDERDSYGAEREGYGSERDRDYYEDRRYEERSPADAATDTAVDLVLPEDMRDSSTGDLIREEARRWWQR